MDAKQRASFINSIGGQPDAAPKAADTAFTISTEGETREVVSAPFAAAEETPPLTSLSEAAAPEPAAPASEPRPAPAVPFAAAAEKPAAPAPAPAAPFAAVPDRPAAPAPAPAVQAEEEENAFAQGLPDWDLVPPQLAVRKRRPV